MCEGELAILYSWYEYWFSAQVPFAQFHTTDVYLLMARSSEEGSYSDGSSFLNNEKWMRSQIDFWSINSKQYTFYQDYLAK